MSLLSYCNVYLSSSYFGVWLSSSYYGVGFIVDLLQNGVFHYLVVMLYLYEVIHIDKADSIS